MELLTTTEMAKNGGSQEEELQHIVLTGELMGQL